MKNVLLLKVSLALAVGILPLPKASCIRAAALTYGNFLVSDEVSSGPGRIREFTPNGTLVQTFSFPASDHPRDIIVDTKGNIAIFNGTFNPVLTVVKSADGTVASNDSYAGWTLVNNSTYGGIAEFGDFIFVTDMATFANGNTRGIIRFNEQDHTAFLFASAQSQLAGDYSDLVAGQDGLLYALDSDGWAVDVYNPITLEYERRVSLPVDVRAIAVDGNGNLFAATINDRHIYQIDPSGNLLRTVETAMNGFVDANIDRNGRLMLSAGENVLLTDRNLTDFNQVHVNTITSSGAIFTAWVESPMTIPEPCTLGLLTVVALAISYSQRHRKRQSVAARIAVAAPQEKRRQYSLVEECLVDGLNRRPPAIA